ncbi:hypothetical protein BsWGS_05545 [Bradybaena similaris]
MTSKSKLSNLFKGKSVPNLPSYSSPWNKNDEKLWNAIKQQNVKQVKALVSKPSVIPTKLGPQGKSVFHLACEVGNEQIIDAILAITQDVNDPTIQGVTALQRAAAKGHTNTVSKLLKKEANVDQRDCNSMTALHHACFGLNQDCVKLLLLKNADPNAVDQGGKTPLFFAAHQGLFDSSRWLLDKGVDVNCQDKDNVTPLMLAAKEGHKNICELLLSRGANPELTDRYGRTAVELAVASKHLELQDIFAKSARGSVYINSGGRSISLSDSLSHQNDISGTVDSSPAHSTSSGARSAEYVNDDESMSHADVNSIHSMDDALLHNRQSSPVLPRQSAPSRIELAHRDLKDEHGRLIENYNSLSVENLKLKDQVESLLKRLPDRHDKELKEVGEMVPKSVYLKEVQRLQEQLEQQHRLMEAQQQTQTKRIVVDSENSNTDSTRKQEVADPGTGSYDDVIAGLKKQIFVLQKENERLKDTVNIPTGSLESSSDGNSQHGQQLRNVLLEREQLDKQLNEHSERQKLNTAVDHKDLLYQNKTLNEEVESLKQAVLSLQEQLEVAKSVPTESERLDAILAASRNFEEVNFDEEGFVEGRDMTKEEFLQAQNQQLRTQCEHLTEELEKLRVTFDAILKAGDNLQADYDHLATEKDALHDELEAALKEKSEIISENELLLTDNNELHENLKKIVHELEKMQEKYQTAQLEIEELKRSVTVASKVGEVARLLEERDILQQRSADLELTSQRLKHDHNILLEEVQSLNESVNQLTGQRNQLIADLEEMEPVCQQHEALQLEYNQLEMEFAELLRDKETLEQQVSNNNEVKLETEPIKGPEREAMEIALNQLREEKQQLEKERQDLEDVVNGLSRHIVATENTVKDLENSLEQCKSQLVSREVDRNGVSDDDESDKDGDVLKHKDEITNLKKQIAQLTKEVEEWEKKHEDTVTTYRTHLLSAVQGHMDPDVKDALYHIIELRSMEQFC